MSAEGDSIEGDSVEGDSVEGDSDASSSGAVTGGRFSASCFAQAKRNNVENKRIDNSKCFFIMFTSQIHTDISAVVVLLIIEIRIKGGKVMGKFKNLTIV